jgi:hypothetical protein
VIGHAETDDQVRSQMTKQLKFDGDEMNDLMTFIKSRYSNKQLSEWTILEFMEAAEEYYGQRLDAMKAKRQGELVH